MVCGCQPVRATSSGSVAPASVASVAKTLPSLPPGRGSTGAAVKALQKRLGVEQAGVFGPRTEKAVKNFQAQQGHKVTGVVTAKTWRSLAA